MTKVPQSSASSSTPPLTLAKGELNSKKASSRQEGSKSESPVQVEKETPRETREGKSQERGQIGAVTKEDLKSSEEPSGQSALKQEALPKPEQEATKGIPKEISQPEAKGHSRRHPAACQRGRSKEILRGIYRSIYEKGYPWISLDLFFQSYPKSEGWVGSHQKHL